MPVRAVSVFYAIAIGLATIGSAVARGLGWTVGTPGWGATGAFVMWAPALARAITVRTVDRGWTAPFRLSTWGRPRLAVLLIPLATELAIYTAAYATGKLFGAAQWAPAWTGTRMALNLAINLPVLAIFGFVVSAGEELGWRGYLQPRLDQAGAPRAFVTVGVLWALFHLPVMILAGYESSALSVRGLTLFTIDCICDSYLWWRACQAAGSLYPAIWFHTFHNITSQWLMPRLFQTSDPAMLGEHGVLPAAFHVIAALAAARLFPRR